MADLEILTAPEVAELLRCSTRVVYLQAKKGNIPGAFRVGGLWRFNRAKLQDMMAGLTTR